MSSSRTSPTLKVASDQDLDAAAAGLVLLTAALSSSGVPISGGLLGGEYGYGGIYENEVFMMHPYCWCEADDCPWCAVCSCPSEAWTYFVDNEPCTYERYEQFFDDEVGAWPHSPATQDAWSSRAAAANARRSSVHQPMCQWCLHPEAIKPNFLHKESGTNFTWYKYIGRAMAGSISGDWTEILADCLASIIASDPALPS